MLSTSVLGFGLMAVRATADEWDKKTTVTFNAPVEVPGTVLPAGTYVFKLLNSPSDRHIVQIYDADEKKLYATILAVPDYRLKPTDKPVLRFEERPSGQPEALEAFFYPGDNFGQQFVYPHKRARRTPFCASSSEVDSSRATVGRSTRLARRFAVGFDVPIFRKDQFHAFQVHTPDFTRVQAGVSTGGARDDFRNACRCPAGVAPAPSTGSVGVAHCPISRSIVGAGVDGFYLLG
ncbi:MAG TPA: hypothetical protein VGG72_08545 [Bryobacteraceae bacterium]